MKKSFLPIFLVISLLILSGGLFVINEKEQAVIIQFGKPVGQTITKAGLKFKIPVIQKVIKFDRRILEWDGSANEIPTKDNKYIFIDAFARWKIVDALQFYKSAKNEMLESSENLKNSIKDQENNEYIYRFVFQNKDHLNEFKESVEKEENIKKIEIQFV